MAQYQLPNDFFFGAAMSGPQTEGQWNQGGKLENLWDTWSIQDLGSFYNCVGSYAGNDFMAKYQEDLRILKDLGLDTYRTSIQWSRLLDADGNLNEEGAAWYHELFRASREAGLEPFVNLYHFDMPTYLFNRGGWESREVVEAYAHYADVAFHEFGQEIKYWFTFNEPIVEPEQRYQEGVWFPQLHDFSRARTVQYHISLAHALAVANYRRAYDEGAIRADAKIGMINCFTPVYTKENPSEADLEAVRMTSGINNRWWLDLITKGELPADVLDSLAEGGVKLPFRAGDQEILKQGVVDWLGCNYYHPTRVQAPASKIDQYGLPHFADEYVWPDAVMNESRGWEIYPQGLYDFGMDCAKNYRIIANELLYNFLIIKVNPVDKPNMVLQNGGAAENISWTESKNALIELIYALHITGAISHGKIGIRKISSVLQILFQIQLGDIHHAFHRMKDRAGNRTLFLDQLKSSVEEYMDKDL